MIASSLLLACSLLKYTLGAPFASSPSAIVARDGTGSVTSSAGLQWYSSNLIQGTSGRSDPSSYTCYSGSVSSFPAMSSWISFSAMWALQVQDALTPSEDTSAEQQAIYNAILSVSQSAKVDPRVILAVIIDESTGNVRVPCTTSNGGVSNCGLMQAYNSSSYVASNMQSSITRMVIDGTQGTAYGPGLVQLFNDAADTSTKTSGNVYAVMRAYNSGKINASQLSDGQGATPAYVSNIANFLQGWNGWGNGPASCNFPNTLPTSTTKPAPTCTAFVAPPTQTVAGSTPNCCSWHSVAGGDNCYAIGTAANITLDQFRAWNTYVDAACDNLWAGYAYCVFGNLAASAVSSSSSTSASGSASATRSTVASTTASSSKSSSTTSTTATSSKPASSGAKVVVHASSSAGSVKASSTTAKTSSASLKSGTATSSKVSATSSSSSKA